jgi:thiol-disulfide isomerase/thioredoxin
MPAHRSFRSVLEALKRRPVAWVSAVLLGVAAIGFAGYRQDQVSSNNAFYAQWGVDPTHLPYDSRADARQDIADARERAIVDGKMLMITFGANWCPDCLTLHRNLSDPGTRAYAARKFEIVNIDVGEFDKNRDVARELDVEVNRIPLAVFFGPDGRPICDTSRGELGPSRHYTSREILEFLREVADYGRVVSPDQRQ